MLLIERCLIESSIVGHACAGLFHVVLEALSWTKVCKMLGVLILGVLWKMGALSHYRADKSSTFFWFFIFFGIHLVIEALMVVGSYDTASAGLLAMLKAFDANQ